MTMVVNEAGGDVAIVADDARGSAVSWGAVIAGAIAAAAVSVLLLLLGSGLGLTVISPWSASNPSLTAIGAATLIWLIFVHWIGSAAGGFLAGRLRSSNAPPGADEVAFRDTAHGFLAWAVAVLMVAVVGGIATSATLFTGVQAAATVAGGAAAGPAAQGAPGQAGAGGAGGGAGASIADPTAYYVDMLFRPASGAAAVTGVTPAAASADLRAEVGRILAKGVAADQFPAEERAYLTDLVAARAGLPRDMAGMRVDMVIAALQDAKAQARDAADKARKAAATAALGLVLALLIGAFVASVAAALGGQLRDDPTR
jgi:hypothetical protein